MLLAWGLPYYRKLMLHKINANCRTRGQKCLLLSKSCHHNENPSATGLFTKGQILVAAGQTSKMPSTTLVHAKLR